MTVEELMNDLAECPSDSEVLIIRDDATYHPDCAYCYYDNGQEQEIDFNENSYVTIIEIN